MNLHLQSEHVRDRIHIINEIADHANPGDIKNIFSGRSDRDLLAQSRKLLLDTVRRLEPAFYMMNRVVVVTDCKVLAQNLDFRSDFLDGGSISMSECLKTLLILQLQIHGKKPSLSKTCEVLDILLT